MEKLIKTVACLCTLTTLFMGCYTSAMIDPQSNERDKIYSGNIKYLVTKDGRKYVFRTAPNIVNGAIVGVIEAAQNPGLMNEDVKQVSIPISDVASVSISEIDTPRTVVAVVAVVGSIALIVALVEWDPHSTHIMSGWK